MTHRPQWRRPWACAHLWCTALVPPPGSDASSSANLWLIEDGDGDGDGKGDGKEPPYAAVAAAGGGWERVLRADSEKVR